MVKSLNGQFSAYAIEKIHVRAEGTVNAFFDVYVSDWDSSVDHLLKNQPLTVSWIDGGSMIWDLTGEKVTEGTKIELFHNCVDALNPTDEEVVEADVMVDENTLNLTVKNMRRSPA